ncbi:MAG: hypothetical protein ACYCW6_30330 [Candidatus Xenobia bacterium]
MLPFLESPAATVTSAALPPWGRDRTRVANAYPLVHGLVFDWLANGEIDGLRIDHPDGLFNPPEYFKRLQEEYLLRVARTRYQGDLSWDEIELPLRAR